MPSRRTTLTRRGLLAAAVPAGALWATGCTMSNQPARSLSSARVVDRVIRPPGLHWVGDGFRVAGYFSAIADAVRTLDPFLMLDYHPTYAYPPSERPRGVGVHPHRGFETVTIAFQGSIAHHDSTGGGGTIGPGDVQWMTAASGILHKEYHEREFSRRGGPFQMAQLWVNLPRAHKMAPPRYQPIVTDQIGVATLPDGAGAVRVIAGAFGAVRGPAQTFTPIELFDVRLAKGGQVELGVPGHHNAALLVMSGDVTVNDAPARADDFVLMGQGGERIDVVASADAQLLVMAGEPIGEPVVQHGPFVMNTRREIAQAFDDYQRGAFGYLED